MALTDIDVAQAACVMVGVEPISSFTEGTTESGCLEENYEDIVQTELALFPWRFAMKQVLLDRLLDVPAGRWSAAYQVPGDCLTIRAVTVSDQQIPYDRYADMIYCDAGEDDAVVMDYGFQPIEQKWPKPFLRIIKHRLAALLAVGVAQMPDIGKYHEDKAENLLLKARHTDSTSQTARKLRPTRLTSRRRGS